LRVKSYCGCLYLCLYLLGAGKKRDEAQMDGSVSAGRAGGSRRLLSDSHPR